LNEETFLYFPENFKTHPDQLEMLKTLDIALNYMKTRDRPWSVIILRALNKKNVDENDFENERRMFGPSVKSIKVLYAGKE